MIETLLSTAPWNTLAGFCRTAHGAEVNLVPGMPGRPHPWAIGIRSGSPPRLTQGFHVACEDIQPGRGLVVQSGERRYPIREGVTAIGLPELAALLANGGDPTNGGSVPVPGG